jgi:hypothetical protein
MEEIRNSWEFRHSIFVAVAESPTRLLLSLEWSGKIVARASSRRPKLR